MQVYSSVISGLHATENVTEAYTTGVDFELTWLPITSLELSASGSWTQEKTAFNFISKLG